MRVAESDRRVHGGIDPRELAELGVTAGEVIDFSVNINPYGPAPSVIEAIRSAALDRYPEPTARAAREALAELDGVEDAGRGARFFCALALARPKA